MWLLRLTFTHGLLSPEQMKVWSSLTSALALSEVVIPKFLFDFLVHLTPSEVPQGQRYSASLNAEASGRSIYSAAVAVLLDRLLMVSLLDRPGHMLQALTLS